METVTHAFGSISVTVSRMFGAVLGQEPDIDPPGKIFVTGATGVLGSRVVKNLLDHGHKDIRLGKCTSSNPEMMDRFREKGVEIVNFSWGEEVTYADALKDVSAVFCVLPYTKNWQAHFPEFLHACKSANVKHFVKISFYHSTSSGDAFQKVPLVSLHGNCDEMLMKSNMPYTIVAASHLMSNALIHQGKHIFWDLKPSVVYGCSHGHGVNYVSPNDVAEVSTRVLLHPKHHVNKEYTLTGSTAVKDQDVAKAIGQHFHKSVMFIDQSFRTYKDTEKNSGYPEWMIQDLLALEEVKASGVEEKTDFVTHDFEDICHRQPESFETYLKEEGFMTPKELGINAC